MNRQRQARWIASTAITLMVIAVCALLCANSTAALVSASLRFPGQAALDGLSSSPHTAPGSRYLREAERGTSEAVSRIIERNLFCSTCEPETEAAASGDDQGAAGAASARDTSHLKLLATLLAKDPAQSFALLGDSTLDETSLYAIGAEVLPAVRLGAVFATHVVLDLGGITRTLPLLDPRPADAAANGEGERRDGPALVAPPRRGALQVQEVGERRYEIDRGSLNAALANPALLAQGGLIAPASDPHGKPAGFAVQAIRPGSLYDQLGLQSGDVLQAVNAHPVRTPDETLAVYQNLKHATQLTLRVQRRGATLDYGYAIR